MDLRRDPRDDRGRDLRRRLRARRQQAEEVVERVPVLGRLVSEFVRIEFIDRCLLIAAQGLLALIPTFVVLVAFFPHLTDVGLSQFSDATGLGPEGDSELSAEVTVDRVRAQTGLIGVLIVLFSATSFARAIQRMYERVWELPHVGGMSGTRRCFLWLIGWLMSIQLVAGVVQLLSGPDSVVPGAMRFSLQAALVAGMWLVTSRLLLFGRVGWGRLTLGAALSGVLLVLYNRGSGLVMPVYVESNAEQFGTLGVILAVSTWMIGFGAILVGSALVGRVVSEDPTVVRVVSSAVAAVRAAPAARRRGAGPPPPRPG